ncbi:MAG: cysteine dioxygenase family protein [Bacteroidales bacterium]|nr:cysteine dioxygenase family protein [Bacteroidales bacterium]
METLDRLLETLENISGTLRLDGSESDISILKGLIKEHSTSDLDLNKYHLDPADKPYGRNILVNNGKVEVVFLSWGPDQICDVHDHGESCGLVKVVKGNISNIIYQEDTVSGEPIHQQEEYVLDDIFIEVPKNSWHQMKNNLDEFSYTLHVYAPPVTDMQVFDKENKQLVTVDENCGAWLSEPDRQIKIKKL